MDDQVIRTSGPFRKSLISMYPTVYVALGKHIIRLKYNQPSRAVDRLVESMKEDGYTLEGADGLYFVFRSGLHTKRVSLLFMRIMEWVEKSHEFIAEPGEVYWIYVSSLEPHSIRLFTGEAAQDQFDLKTKFGG